MKFIFTPCFSVKFFADLIADLEKSSTVTLKPAFAAEIASKPLSQPGIRREPGFINFFSFKRSSKAGLEESKSQGMFLVSYLSSQNDGDSAYSSICENSVFIGTL